MGVPRTVALLKSGLALSFFNFGLQQRRGCCTAAAILPGYRAQEQLSKPTRLDISAVAVKALSGLQLQPGTAVGLLALLRLSGVPEHVEGTVACVRATAVLGGTGVQSPHRNQPKRSELCRTIGADCRRSLLV